MTTWLKLEDGQGLVEYALLLLLIAVVCAGALTLLGTQVNTTYLGFTAAL